LGQRGVRLNLKFHLSLPYLHAFRFQLAEFAKDTSIYPVAIDLRGYNDSDKQWSKNISFWDQLRQDVKNVITGLGFKKAFLVTHDWYEEEEEKKKREPFVTISFFFHQGSRCRL
jgi:hypothetical protein